MNKNNPGDLIQGWSILEQNLQDIQEEKHSVDDVHTAFEWWCLQNFTLGTNATDYHIGGSHDIGCDAYSQEGNVFHVIQSKIPENDYLESHPDKPKTYGPGVLKDPRDALEYLLQGKKRKANERVKILRSRVDGSKKSSDFRLTFFLVVYGRFRSGNFVTKLEELQREYEDHNAKLVVKSVDDIVALFLAGSKHKTGKIKFNMTVHNNRTLHFHNYRFFLTTAEELRRAYDDYGMRLFDLNVRGELKSSKINRDIVEALSSSKSRKDFHHANNGVTLVASNAVFSEKEELVRLVDPQIINGLQTVKSIWNAEQEDEVTKAELDDCLVQVKVIENQSTEYVLKIVKATNNQNPMSPRNLKSHNPEQKFLTKKLSSIKPRWFLQTKDKEWDSLSSEGGRWFKARAGYGRDKFMASEGKKARVIDNKEAAKAWLAFMGFADWAETDANSLFDGITYETAFRKSPNDEHWQKLHINSDYSLNREKSKTDRTVNLADNQASAEHYLLACGLWEFLSRYIPGAKANRTEALNRGVKAERVKKSDGSIISSAPDQEAWLAQDEEYQTWKIMTNSKPLMIEFAARILSSRYGSLSENLCKSLLHTNDMQGFFFNRDLQSAAENARNDGPFESQEVVSRIFCFLHYVIGQFWNEYSTQIMSDPRVKRYLYRKSTVRSLENLVKQKNALVGIEYNWKPAGVTFIDSLPDIKEVT